MATQDAQAVGVYVALKNRIDACPFRRKVESGDAGEQADMD